MFSTAIHWTHRLKMLKQDLTRTTQHNMEVSRQNPGLCLAGTLERSGRKISWYGTTVANLNEYYYCYYDLGPALVYTKCNNNRDRSYQVFLWSHDDYYSYIIDSSIWLDIMRETTKKEETAKTVSDDLAGLGESGSTFLLMHILTVKM